MFDSVYGGFVPTVLTLAIGVRKEGFEEIKWAVKRGFRSRAVLHISTENSMSSAIMLTRKCATCMKDE